VEVVVVSGALADGIDGVLPLTVFADFVIRLDVGAKTLDLFARSGDPVTSSDIPSSLLLVRCILNDRHEGYFVLDTGSSYTAISTDLATRMISTGNLGERFTLQGGTARVEACRVTEVLRLRMGATRLSADPVMAMDLSSASRFHNFPISGLLGFPALRDTVLSVDYRRGSVSIDPK